MQTKMKVKQARDYNIENKLNDTLV